MSFTNFPKGVTSFGVPLPAGSGWPAIKNKGQYWFVDGTYGSDGNEGTSPTRAFASIGQAIAKAGANDVIAIFPKTMAATDTAPGSYAETVIITQPGLSLIGVSHGHTQGGLPQIKIGAGSTAMITVRAPGCLIANLGFDGASSTGGGILLDDDASTKSAFGTTIIGCHFRNCVGSAAALTGGAIMWAATGNASQTRIEGNRFYDNRGGIILKGTTGSRPKDVIITGNVFGAAVNTTIDCDIYGAAGTGFADVTITNNVFETVDVPAYATSPTAARYMDLTGCTGTVAFNSFACIGQGTSAKTFGATGTGALIPTTVRMAGNFGEIGATATVGEIPRT